MDKREVFSQVNAGSTDDELRSLSASSGVPFDELWHARRRWQHRFENDALLFSRYVRNRGRG